MKGVVAGTAKPKPTPFYKDPNIWTLLGVLVIQIITVVVTFFIYPLFPLLYVAECFPFVGYEQIVTLPGVFVLLIVAVFVFTTIINTMGKRGKNFVRWTILVLALGSAAMAIGHATELMTATQSSGGFFSNFHY